MNNHTPAEIQYVRERIEVSPNGCWVWMRALHKGYGYAYLGGVKTMAHRLSYEAHVGPIPDGLQLDHLCRNRACVNPHHLEPVTIAVNVARSMVPSAASRREGRCVRGLHPMSGPNLRVRPDGRYLCRACRKAARAEKRKSRAAA